MSPWKTAILIVLFILVGTIVISITAIKSYRDTRAHMEISQPSETTAVICAKSEIRKASVSEIQNSRCEGRGDTIHCQDGYEIRPDGSVWQVNMRWFMCPKGRK